jgi:hypothetical protein
LSSFQSTSEIYSLSSRGTTSSTSRSLIPNEMQLR